MVVLILPSKLREKHNREVKFVNEVVSVVTAVISAGSTPLNNAIPKVCGVSTQNSWKIDPLQLIETLYPTNNFT